MLNNKVIHQVKEGLNAHHTDASCISERKKKITSSKESKSLSYFVAMRPINGLAIFLVDGMTGVVGTTFFMVIMASDLVIILGHPLLTTRFLHGHPALDHRLVFGVLHSFHFVLTQVSVGIQVGF